MPSLSVNDRELRSQGRVAGLRLVLLTLRLMENWKHDVDDYDRAMILVAVAAITAERLLRSDLPPDWRSLSRPIGAGELAKCNISSIASATGLNRETTRRKVDRLIEQQLLTRLEDGTLTFAPGIIQEETTSDLVRRQLDEIVRTTNELLRDSIVTFS